jgi:hypothetical protein
LRGGQERGSWKLPLLLTDSIAPLLDAPWILDTAPSNRSTAIGDNGIG